MNAHIGEKQSSVELGGCGNILVINRRRAVSGRQIISAPTVPNIYEYIWKSLNIQIFWEILCVWRRTNSQTWMLNKIWNVFHLKFSKAPNWWKNYISTTSDDQIWPGGGYRKISVCLAGVLCTKERCTKNGAKNTLQRIVHQFSVVSNLWQCWHLGQPNSGQSSGTPNHRHYGRRLSPENLA